MNKEKVKRMARDLASMTAQEAQVVMQLMTQQHGRAVARIAADALLTAVKSPVVLEVPYPPQVLLRNCGEKKIMVIKTLREQYHNALVEAKHMVDSAPILLDAPPTGSIHELLEALRAAGATVELK